MKLCLQWDVVVVGTGIGGATTGYALAKAGRSVLFLERGHVGNTRGFVEAEAGYHRLDEPERRARLALGGRNSDAWRDARRGDEYVPYVGSGPGGSSALYGMALERMFPSDFESWPISYDELKPWYAVAERLYRVRGTQDPLRTEPADHLLAPPPLSAANRRIFEHLAGIGLHPYRLHLACEHVAGCRLCQGHLCDAACKNDAVRVCLEPALGQGHVKLVTGARVTNLEVNHRNLSAVHADVDGTSHRFEAKVVVLAAGALASPVLLLSSGLPDSSNLVGRRLMRHAIDLFVLRKAPPAETPGDSKELGLNDFYQDPEKLGTVQSFGLAPPYEYLRNQPGRNLWRWMGPLGPLVARRFARAPIVAGILEDSPDPDNRVEPGVIAYRLGADDTRRRVLLRQQLRQAFSRFGPVLITGTDDRKGLGHVCGTCRFGTNPQSSVLDEWNRMHGIDNLYVTDASFFPTSAGVNPALTIAANALRVANELKRRL